MTDGQHQIIDAISAEIAVQARQCAAEQHAPGHDPDAMDEYIRERQKNVAVMRRHREELENLFIGFIP